MYKNKIKEILENNLDIVFLPYGDKEGLNLRINKSIEEILNLFKDKTHSIGLDKTDNNKINFDLKPIEFKTYEEIEYENIKKRGRKSKEN